MDVRKGQPDKKATTFPPYPTTNKDNFRIYHQPDDAVVEPAVWSQRSQTKHSIYPTSPDNPCPRKIVNASKPQVTLRYINVRGKQIRAQESKRVSGNSSSHAKRKKLSSNVREPVQVADY